jgi:hypothetical protein
VNAVKVWHRPYGSIREFAEAIAKSEPDNLSADTIYWEIVRAIWLGEFEDDKNKECFTILPQADVDQAVLVIPETGASYVEFVDAKSGQEVESPFTPFTRENLRDAWVHCDPSTPEPSYRILDKKTGEWMEHDLTLPIPPHIEPATYQPTPEANEAAGNLVRVRRRRLDRSPTFDQLARMPPERFGEFFRNTYLDALSIETSAVRRWWTRRTGTNPDAIYATGPPWKKNLEAHFHARSHSET